MRLGPGISPRAEARLPQRAVNLLRTYNRELSLRQTALPTRPSEIAVVTPARNEADRILGFLAQLLAAARITPDLWGLIVCNGCTDNTADLVRQWCREHAAEVELLEQLDAQPAADDRFKLWLLDDPTPGRPQAMLRQEDWYHAQGHYPKWVMELDVDTFFEPEAIRDLARHAEARNLTGAAAHMVFRLPGGRRPRGFYDFDQTLQGRHGIPFLSGGLSLVRPAKLIAALRALQLEEPAVINEDSIITLILLTAGERLEIVREVKIETEPSTDLVRWYAAPIQMKAIFGRRVIYELGPLAPHPSCYPVYWKYKWKGASEQSWRERAARAVDVVAIVVLNATSVGLFHKARTLITETEQRVTQGRPVDWDPKKRQL